MRPTRNKELLKLIAKKACLVCSKGPCDPHHVQSRGAGGEDSEENVNPLCRDHHTEWHTKGAVTFCLDHPAAWAYLWAMGWECDAKQKKLFRPVEVPQ